MDVVLLLNEGKSLFEEVNLVDVVVARGSFFSVPGVFTGVVPFDMVGGSSLRVDKVVGLVVVVDVVVVVVVVVVVDVVVANVMNPCLSLS